MPRRSSVILASAVVSLANAAPWTPPAKTAPYQADDWSPRPTPAPAPPAQPAVELFKRQTPAADVCGWIGGDFDNPALCSAGSSCVYDVVHGYVGCCAISGPCTAGIYTSCVDANSVGWSPNAGLEDNGIFTCSGTSVCYRNTYPGGFYQYGCGASNMATTVETTYSGQASDGLLKIVYTAILFSPTSAAASSSSSPLTSASPTASPPVTSSAKLATTSPSEESAVTSSTLRARPSRSPMPSFSRPEPSGTEFPPGGFSGPPLGNRHRPKRNPGIIAALSTVGSVLMLAAVALLVFICFRRRSQRYRAGPFTSVLNSSNPPPNGPFRKEHPYYYPYSPDDIRSPAPYSPDDIRSIAPYSPSTPNSYPKYSTGPYFEPDPPSPSYFPASREETPLVTTEIETFSRAWHGAIPSPRENAERDTRIPAGTPPNAAAADIGLAMTANERMEEIDLGSEPVWNEPVQRENVREEGWSPQGLRTSPTRDSLARRYELVDEIPSADNLPILRSPNPYRNGFRVRTTT